MSEDAGFRIGEVSERTGIPVETLRTWERRYGFPAPGRTSSGHRRYGAGTLLKLELIVQALERGHRAGGLVELELPELRELLRVTSPADAAPPPAPRPALDRGDSRAGGVEQAVARWMDAVAAYDVEGLAADFERCWYRHGVLDFVTRLVPPFLRQIGEGWEHGRLHEAQEHVASQRLREFLSAQWRPLSARAAGPRVLCALLPEEEHALGLHLVATLLALGGCRVVFLGADTPLVSIVAAAQGLQARALCVSLSHTGSSGRARRDLLQLRERLPGEVRVVVGGCGAPCDIDGVEELELDELPRWLITL